MRYRILILLTCLSILFSTKEIAAQDGATTFKTVCAACHTIGKGRLVGPDLAGVSDRRSEDWLIKFIKSSQTVINSGDKTADSLFQAYNKTLMPDHPNLDDAKIKDVLAYIKTTSASSVSSGGTNSSPTETVAVQKPEKFLTPANIWLLIGMLVLLIVIFALYRINKSLQDQIRDFYSSDRSFFKKGPHS
ncbi:MAG: cytochrome c [Bacteroidetes bacterium]|nr:cytochrome c [Bacteroidota bacterium]